MAASKLSVSGTGGHTQPEPSREPEPGLLPPRADLCPGPTQFLVPKPLGKVSSSSQGREIHMLQKDEMCPFLIMPGLKGGTGSPDSDTQRNSICVPGGSGGTGYLRPGSCFRLMGGGLSGEGGAPFPQHSGNDLWILDPGEPRLLPPQLVPLRTASPTLTLLSLDPALSLSQLTLSL